MAGIRLYPKNEEVIRRWVNEVQDGVKNSSHMVQYHALHLLHKIKQFDRGALAKVSCFSNDWRDRHLAQSRFGHSEKIFEKKPNIHVIGATEYFYPRIPPTPPPPPSPKTRGIIQTLTTGSVKLS
jgi:hypothetical protein